MTALYVATERCLPPLDPERPPTPLGAYLRRLRRQRRYSQQLLADTAGITPQYLRQLEAGYKPGSNRPVEPSPRVLRALAEALADGHPAEAEAIYAEFIDLAGYGPLPPPPPPVAVLPAGSEERRALLRRLIEAELEALDDPLRTAVLRLVLEALPPGETT